MSVESANRLEKNPAGDKENIASLLARGRAVPVGGRPLVMGILNINDDSFSGDGRLDTGWALEKALGMVAAGADVVDVGGESARTNRAPVSEEEEWRRIAPFLEKFPSLIEKVGPRDEGQVFPPLLSVNTWRTTVAARAMKAGCDLLNDMSALPDATHARLCAEHGSALLIMHSKGLPKIPHTHVEYRDVMAELEEFFEEKIAMAVAAGVPKQSLVVDPGIDFAKQTDDNLRILREFPRLARFGCPILLPVSRKSTIGRVLGIENPADRDAGTIACTVAGALRGAAILRVHNVDAARLALRAVTLVR
ncbi:MAG: dihydropteroate synthase [Verrucomicrobia bacterium]|nr:dihydropteroate synthase [Verrucomicrobiota bacterium]